MQHPAPIPPPLPFHFASDAGVDLVSVLRAERARQIERLQIIEQSLAAALARERLKEHRT